MKECNCNCMQCLNGWCKSCTCDNCDCLGCDCSNNTFKSSNVSSYHKTFNLEVL